MSDSTGVRVLALNGGSSSVKFGLYEAHAEAVTALASGEVETAVVDEALFSRIDAALGDSVPDAVGHRIVHGGPSLFHPVVINHAVIARLREAKAFAPLHMPASLELIGMAQTRYAGVPHVACFDTGFHADLPDIAAVLPIPQALRRDGLRRYGFHGLSCQSVLHQLGGTAPERLIIAHLGSGASVTAVRAGHSVDTSMGLTPSGGVVMGTRAGDVDPGLLLHMIRQHGMDADALEDVIDRHSGLLGISGVSGDLRRLHAAGQPDAALALRIFSRSISKAIAGMMASLGGADLIVFTGGVGENDAEVRSAIIDDLNWAGVSGEGGRVRVEVLPSQEVEQIAREVSGVMRYGVCASSIGADGKAAQPGWGTSIPLVGR